MGRRELSAEFKQEAVQRVLEQGHTVKMTAKALGISETALRRWLGPRLPTSVEAANWAQEQIRIRELETRVVELERERDMLKKSLGALTGKLDCGVE